MSETTITRKSNRYPGRCTECGLHVAADEGWLVGKNHRNGSWLVAHNACPHPELVKLYNPTANDNAAEAELAEADARETAELESEIDGMMDTLCCRSEEGDCVDYTNPVEVAEFEAGTRKLQNEIDMAIAMLTERKGG